MSSAIRLVSRVDRAPTTSTTASRGPRVADQLVALLRTRGVERVFGIPGGAISPLFDALIGSGVDVVIAQHEGMAAYLAYGHARATGQPGVVLVTSGPGVLNAVTGIAAAQLDEVPLLVLAGDVKSPLAGRGALQDGGPSGVDVLQVTRSLTKRVESVGHAERAVAAVQEALDAALSEPRGAAFVNVAMDAAVTTAPPGHVVSGAAALPAAPDDVCDRLLAALTRAERPALWLGIGARLAGVADAVLRLAEQAACPVVCDVEAKGLFPERHPLSLGLVGVGSAGVAERYLEGADLLVTVGARLDDTTTLGFRPALRGREMFQLDTSAERLNRGYPADVAVRCDLGATVGRLVRAASSPPAALVDHRRRLVADARAHETVVDVPPLERAPHHPAAVVHALQRALPPDTVFTADIGNHMLFAARHLVLDEPDRFHVSQGLGGMGSGIGVAMGLAFADRARPVVGICGDGSFRMVATEIATCAAADVPVVLAVLDDEQLGMVEHGNQRVFGRSAFCRAPRVDVVALARSLGARAARVDRLADLHEALAAPSTGPLVLHFPIRADVKPANARDEVIAFPEA